MTVKELRDFLITQTDLADDSALVVLFGGDHTLYQVSRADFDDAEKTKNNALFEYFTDDDMEPGSKRVRVFVVS